MKNKFTFMQKRMVFFGVERLSDAEQLAAQKSPEEIKREEEENERRSAETEKKRGEEKIRQIKEYEEQMPNILQEYADVVTKSEDKMGNVTYNVKHEVVGMLDLYVSLEYKKDGTLAANVNTLNVVDANGNRESFNGERMDMPTLRKYLTAVRKMIESYKKKQ